MTKSYKHLLAFSVFIMAGSVLAQNTGLKTPNISANALFLYQNSNFHKEDIDPANVDQSPNGIGLQEAELQFYSDVDPYTKLNLLFSIHPEYESNGIDVEEKWILEPEEAFAESNYISNLSMKLGKFKAAMGKQNTLHTHAFAFIQTNIQNSILLGDEGLNDYGLSAATLLPTSWFSEITFQYLRGKGENTEFNSPSPGDAVGLIHYKNLFDLSNDLTMEVGLSGAQGKNSYKANTTLTGANLIFKWRPTEGGKYRSLIWSTEYLGRTQAQSGNPDEKGNGFSTWLQYQFAERWAALYRYDQVKIDGSFTPATLPDDTIKRNSIALAFNPSEFSTLKLEYDMTSNGVANAHGDKDEKAIYLQANFSIGSHPAHTF